MTNQEITRTIAEKVMGYELVPASNSRMYAWRDKKTGMLGNFDPLIKEHHCMAAWDKFSEVQEATQLSFSDVQNWSAGFHKDGRWSFVDGATDRKRAMCECMSKGVTA